MFTSTLTLYEYVILLRIRNANKADEQRLVSWCALKKNVMYCTKHIGHYDFEINAAITDIDDLNKFLTELKDNFTEIIDSYSTLIKSKLIKLNYIPF